MKLSITRMDSKGRISIPMAMRHHMRLGRGDELMLTTKSKELRLLPVNGGNAELSIRFKKSASVSGSLSSVMNVLARHKADIINSEMRTGDCASWHAVIEAADHRKLRSSIAGIEAVQEFSLRRNG